MKRVLLFAVVVLALGVSEAQAAPFTPLMNRAYGLATAHWGAEPSLCTTIDKEIVPSGTLPEGESGWASIPDEPEPCVLYLDRWMAKPLRFAPMCRIMVHEVGHLLGLDHSFTVGDVMNPETETVPPICQRAADRAVRWIGG